MAESSRRYNLRDTRKKPQGVLLKLWEEEYTKVISNENRRIPLEKAKNAIRSAFEDGMFEQWRITLKCPLSGQRIRVPARYADCTHIECFDLEAFLRMKTQKNLRVCPICQKEVEKPLANLRIDKYIENVLSTLPDAMQVELLPEGSFIEVHEEFVAVPNVINNEEPFVQDNNAPAVEIKQEVLEDDDEYITLSDGEEDSIDSIIVKMKPIYFMPLYMDIKPKIDSPPKQTHSKNDQEIQDQHIFATQKESQSHKKRIHLGNASGNSIGDPKKRRVLLNDNQSAGPLADVNAHSGQSSSEINASSDSSGNENDGSRTMTNENEQHRNPTISTESVLDVPSGPAPKIKITTIAIDIIYGTASFQTSDGKYYPNRPLSEYVSILREIEADVCSCEAHIVFRSLGMNWDISEIRVKNVLGFRKKFEEFSQDVHSISHLWKNGRISVELYQCSDYVNAFLSTSDVCNALFGQDRSILKCKVLDINWLSDSWPFSVIMNAVHHCNQLIFKINQHPTQQLCLYLFYEMTLPQHIDITLEFNKDAYYFISELEKRFQRSNAQYFKFKLVSPLFPQNKLLRNEHGTLEMKKVSSHHDASGLRHDTVMIEQCPHTSVPYHESTDAVPKLKISKIRIDLCYRTASFKTSEGQEYDGNPLSDYVSILRESEADVHGCQAHIGPMTPARIWGKAGFCSDTVLGSQEKFGKFSQDVHSISHLWENGRISVELLLYSDYAKSFLPVYNVCEALFGQDRSILKCKVMEINWFSESWPFSLITNVAHHCEQLIFKQLHHPRLKLHQTFLDILYTVTLPQHLDVTLKLNYRKFGDFIDELEKRFQRSNAQYFKFKLVSPWFPQNKLLRNDHGTLEMKIVTSHRYANGLRIDTVIIEQRPHTISSSRSRVNPVNSNPIKTVQY